MHSILFKMIILFPKRDWSMTYLETNSVFIFLNKFILITTSLASLVELIIDTFRCIQTGVLTK